MMKKTMSGLARRFTFATMVAALLGLGAGLVPRVAFAVVVRTATVYRPRPVARAAVVGTAAVGTAVAVGAVARTIPPSCTSIVVGGVAYRQCGATWYQPRYAGSDVTYVVVSPPR